jgi:hypothetical protein
MQHYATCTQEQLKTSREHNPNVLQYPVEALT